MNLFKKRRAVRFYNKGMKKTEKSSNRQDEVINKYEAAIKYFTKAIKLDPEYKDAYVERAYAYYFTEKHNELDAIKDYTKAIELDPNDASIYLKRGDAHFDLRFYESLNHDNKHVNAAIKDYTKVIELDHYDIDTAYYERGKAYDSLKEYEKAIKDFEKVIEIGNYNELDIRVKIDIVKEKIGSLELINKPTTAKELYEKGMKEMNYYHTDLAIRCFSKALELDSNYFDAYYNRGIAYLKSISSEYATNEYAINDFTRAIRLKPDDEKAYYERAKIYNDKGNYENAINDFNKIVEINPNNTDAYFNRGISYDGLKKFSEAIEDYSKVIELDPGDDQAYNNRGQDFLLSYKFDEAIKDWQKALEINPSFDFILIPQIQYAKEQIKIFKH